MSRITIRRSTITVFFALLLLLSLASTVFAVTPIAQDDTFSVNPNVRLTRSTQATGILANDTDFDPVTQRIETYDKVTAQGGSVVVNPDGSFIYDPPVGFRGVDFFTYTLRADEGTDSATVTLDVTAGPVTWFVNPAAAAGGNGTYLNPFNNPLLVSSNSLTDVDGVGDRIFVYDGVIYTTPFALEEGQTLHGQGASIDLSASGVTIPSGASVIPDFNAIGIIVTAANNNAIRGINFLPTTNYAISATDTTGTLTISDSTITSSSNGGGINLAGVSGTVNVTNTNITGTINSGRAGLGLTRTTVPTSANITFTNSDITAIQTGSPVATFTTASNPAYSGTLTFNNTSDISATSGNGLSLEFVASTAQLIFNGTVNVTATTNEALQLTRGGTGDNIDLTLAQGVTLNSSVLTGYALWLTNVNLTLGGTTSTLTATQGGAAFFQGVAIAGTATFANMTATATCVSCGSLNSGIFAANSSGTIDVNGTTSINTIGTRGIRIQNSGSFNFTTNVLTLTSSGVSPNGVGVSLNTAGTFTVESNTSAITANNNTAFDATAAALNVVFANITSTSASTNGIVMDNTSGTFTVSTRANLSSKSLSAVDIRNSTTNVTFRELDITNSFDGVFMSGNTGAFSFTVQGTGTTDGSGGTFQTMTNNAFDLFNTRNLVLNNLDINTTGSHAFIGRQVTNLTLENVNVTLAGDANDEHAMLFRDPDNVIQTDAFLTGTVMINNSSFSQMAENAIDIENFRGTLNLTIQNTLFSNNISRNLCVPPAPDLPRSCEGSAIQLRADANVTGQPPTMTVLVQNNVFNDIDQDGVDAGAEGNNGAVMNMTIQNNDFNSFLSPLSPPEQYVKGGDNAVTLHTSSGNGTLNFKVLANTMDNYLGSGGGAIRIEGGGTNSNLTGEVGAAGQPNTITTVREAMGMQILADGTDTYNMFLRVANNTFTGTDRSGIYVVANSGVPSSLLDIALLNNTVNTPTNVGVGYEAGAAFLVGEFGFTDSGTVCAAIVGNTLRGSGGPASGIGDDIYLAHGANTTFRVQGYPGGDIIAYLMGINNILDGYEATETAFTGGDCTSDTMTVNVPLP